MRTGQGTAPRRGTRPSLRTRFVRSARCPHDVPEPVILQSRSGRRWCVVRCSLCGKRLG